MGNYTITMRTFEKEGVLDIITSLIASKSINITYTHLFVEDSQTGTINLELEGVDDIDALVEELKNLEVVRSIKILPSLYNIYGKRILIFGGGAQVSQVALGAITEADRHNIRGERISVDTLPVVGEENISEAVSALSSLPRINALVLAGSLMGGEITNAVSKIKKDTDLTVISLNMPGSVTSVADLVVTDPIQAGVMAVMAVANTAVFDIKKLKGNNKF